MIFRPEEAALERLSEKVRVARDVFGVRSRAWKRSCRPRAASSRRQVFFEVFFVLFPPLVKVKALALALESQAEQAVAGPEL